MHTADQPITVVVRRVVRAGREAEFEEAMRTFIAESLGFPGSSDFHVVRPSSAGSREYTIVHRFTDAASRRAFVASPVYARWTDHLLHLSEDEPRRQEYAGIAGWFTLADNRSTPARHRPPSKLSMALVTFLGVYPLTATLPPAFARAMPDVHPLLINVCTTGTIVALLTWVVMPILTRVFARWLFGPDRPHKESSA